MARSTQQKIINREASRRYRERHKETISKRYRVKYAADPQKYKDRSKRERESDKGRDRLARHRAKRKAWIRELREQPCTDCGKEYPYYVMEFHHRNPAEKIAAIGTMCNGVSYQILLDALARCDLLWATYLLIGEFV